MHNLASECLCGAAKISSWQTDSFLVRDVNKKKAPVKVHFTVRGISGGDRLNVSERPRAEHDH